MLSRIITSNIEIRMPDTIMSAISPIDNFVGNVRNKHAVDLYGIPAPLNYALQHPSELLIYT